MIETLFSPEEISKILGVCKHTVYRKIYDGKLKAIKDGGLIRIYESDLKAYLKAHYDIRDGMEWK